MTNSALPKLAVALLMCLMLAIVVPKVAEATLPPECMVDILCPAVTSNVNPGSTCCTILGMGNSYMSPQAACECYTASVKTIPGYSWDLSSQLPNKCGIYLPYPISRSVNCSSV
ncbi:Non-specific lipid-transfer protein 3-like protein [Drosera capensis]